MRLAPLDISEKQCRDATPNGKALRLGAVAYGGASAEDGFPVAGNWRRKPSCRTGLTSRLRRETRLMRAGSNFASLQEFRTSPFKVTNEDTLFQWYHPDLSAQILGFLKVEITNLRSEFHHLERASPSAILLG